MIRVGITGGIGSGKSLICKAFETFGIPVFYADTEVKKMYDDNAEVHEQLIATFGNHIYSNGKLDRIQLAQKVFGDSEALAKLNAIAHPAVGKRFDSWASQQKNVPYVMNEAALMFESHANELLDKIICVTAPETLRIQRVVQRDNCTPDEVRQRMSHQLSDTERNALANFIIVNDDATPLLPQILKIHEQLLKM